MTDQPPPDQEQSKSKESTGPKETFSRVSPLQMDPKAWAVPPVYEKDPWFYRIIAGTLGSIVFSATLGAIVLSLLDKKIPEQILLAFGSAAIGALAGTLAQRPR